MSYIRTTDTVTTEDILDIQNPRLNLPSEWRAADTIEELCDYVFFKDWEGKLQIRKMFGGDKQIKSLLLNGATEIKLAILTDKGLIYVAKINEKGESELL